MYCWSAFAYARRSQLHYFLLASGSFGLTGCGMSTSEARWKWSIRPHGSAARPHAHTHTLWPRQHWCCAIQSLFSSPGDFIQRSRNDDDVMIGVGNKSEDYQWDFLLNAWARVTEISLSLSLYFTLARRTRSRSMYLYAHTYTTNIIRAVILRRSLNCWRIYEWALIWFVYVCLCAAGDCLLLVNVFTFCTPSAQSTFALLCKLMVHYVEMACGKMNDLCAQPQRRNDF